MFVQQHPHAASNLLGVMANRVRRPDLLLRHASRATSTRRKLESLTLASAWGRVAAFELGHYYLLRLDPALWWAAQR